MDVVKKIQISEKQQQQHKSQQKTREERVVYARWSEKSIKTAVLENDNLDILLLFSWVLTYQKECNIHNVNAVISGFAGLPTVKRT